MDLFPTEILSNIYDIVSKIGSYFYHNITIPRVSSTYQYPQFPSFKDIIVHIVEILSTIHPNYYIISLLFVCIFWVVYIAIRYPFWNSQPILHTYDYWRKMTCVRPYIIRKIPYKLRFYDKEKQITTMDYSKVININTNTLENTKSATQYIAEFIQCHYIPTDRLLSTISEKVLNAYMSGHNAPSFVSLHQEYDTRITGVITSRLSNIFLHDYHEICETEPTHVEAYFMDFMCVHRECTAGNRRIAERLFQTHEYNQRIYNPTIPVSLFRKEGVLCEGVEPFIPYTKYTYYMRNLNVPPLPSSFTISRVIKQNTDLVHDIYHILTKSNNTASSLFSVCILPDIGHFLSLLEKRELYLFCLKNGEHLYGIYIFRNAHIHYEELDGETIELVGTIQNTENSTVFVTGFMHALRGILKEKKQFKMLSISTIGHNQTILQKWREYHHTVLETQCALYLYNYVLPKMPVDVTRCFVVI